MAFETLDIKIKAESGDAESALDDVRDSLIESDAAVEQFSSSLNEAEEETEELADETGSLNRSLTALIGVSNRAKESLQNVGNAAKGASVSIATLGGSITLLEAALAPLVAGGAVALGAVAGGLAAVAGAAGLVIGSGLLAFGQELAGNNQRRLNQLNKRIATLETLGETESGLTAQQSEQLKTLKNRRKEVEETTTAAGALTNRFADIQSAFVDAFSKAGEQFVPLVRDGLNALPPLIRRLGQAFGNADLSNVTALLRDLGRFIQQNAVPALRSFLQFANDVAGAIRRIGRTEQANTVIGGLQDAFGAMASSLPTVVDAIGKFVNEAIAFAQSDQFREILNEVRTQFEELRPELIELGDNLTSILDTLAEEAPSIIRGVGAAIDLTADAVNALTPLINLTIRILGRLGRDLASFRNDTEEAVRSTRNLISTTKNVIQDIGTFLTSTAPGIIQSGARGLFDSLVAAAKELKRDLIGNSILKDIFRDFATFLKTTATTLVGNAIDTVVGVIKAPFENEGSDGIIDTLKDIFRDFASFLKDTATTLVGNAIDTVVSAIEAPFQSINFGGVIDTLNDIIDTAEDALDPVTNVPEVPDVEFPDEEEEQQDTVRPNPSEGDTDNDGGRTTNPSDPAGPTDPTPSPGDDNPAAGGGGGLDSGFSDDRPDPDPGGGGGGFVGLATGGLITSGGAAVLHPGERVVPAAQVEDRGPAPSGVSIQNLTINASSRAEGRQAAKGLKDELKRFDI